MPPFRIHSPADNSVPHLDAEQIDYNPFKFVLDLEADMEKHDTCYLAKHYPELIFYFLPGKNRPALKPDFQVSRRNGWMIANWRH